MFFKYRESWESFYTVFIRLTFRKLNFSAQKVAALNIYSNQQERKNFNHLQDTFYYFENAFQMAIFQVVGEEYHSHYYEDLWETDKILTNWNFNKNLINTFKTKSLYKMLSHKKKWKLKKSSVS